MTNYAFYAFDYGFLKVGYENNCLVYLKRKDEVDDEDIKTEFSDGVFSQILEYLQGKRKTFDFNYQLGGTEFQRKVWAALCDIPYGEIRTYKDIAVAVGNPKASRAVGMANNKNPITIAIPCHRVIGSNGKLVGYAGGVKMKEELLKLEKENR